MQEASVANLFFALRCGRQSVEITSPKKGTPTRKRYRFKRCDAAAGVKSQDPPEIDSVDYFVHRMPETKAKGTNLLRFWSPLLELGIFRTDK